jgi:hypothetical protein
LPVLVSLALLAFLGISALGGGIAMTFGLGGDYALPEAWLEALPIVESWVIPGLVLGIGFGIGSLVVAWGMLARPRWPALGILESWTGRHWSWFGTMCLGLGQVIWIALELVFLPEPSWLQGMYGPLGLALLLLPLTGSMRRFLAV